ncbi:PREDICTED: adhesive plaque matrix protein-like isoform X2 [Priapulus caudatus]|uniref:Adhesive plaque matrix protein-like isoform X2 n=1 Tax=Priapulus caudatus TaxID=37621 RepID=A0ABM1ERF8_PRICU|nr:PREDICTED: adhesive plaque matrix protein-like isoform X2 [Priapulus caudatus]
MYYLQSQKKSKGGTPFFRKYSYQPGWYEYSYWNPSYFHEIGYEDDTYVKPIYSYRPQPRYNREKEIDEYELKSYPYLEPMHNTHRRTYGCEFSPQSDYIYSKGVSFSRPTSNNYGGSYGYGNLYRTQRAADTRDHSDLKLYPHLEPSYSGSHGRRSYGVDITPAYDYLYGKSFSFGRPTPGYTSRSDYRSSPSYGYTPSETYYSRYNQRHYRPAAYQPLYSKPNTFRSTYRPQFAVEHQLNRAGYRY